MPDPEWPLVVPDDDGIRPASGDDTHCFYCHAAIGQPHRQDCVIVTKLVRLAYTIEVDVRVPYAWDQAQIEFHRNEGSWCADNAVKDITAHTNTVEDSAYADQCLCDRFSAKFITTLDDTPTRRLNQPATGKESA